MCLIIAKPFGKTFDKNHLLEAAKTNRDGIGMSYRVRTLEGQELPTIRVVKSMDMRKAIADWEAIYTHPNFECVIHLRYGTHGSVSLDNVHPFTTTHGYHMHHNGILPIKTWDNMTDTECYMNSVIDNYSGELLFNEFNRREIESDIGAYNKFVFHTPSGIEIMNEASGHWHSNGCWYSNYGYEREETGWSKNDFKRYGTAIAEFSTASSFSSSFNSRNDLEELVYEVDALLPNHTPLWKAALMAQLEAYVAATPESFDMTDDEIDEWIHDIDDTSWVRNGGAIND